MKYLRYENIEEDAKDASDGEIFTVYAKDNSPQIFVKTEARPDLWAFGIKIKGEITLSQWNHDNVGEAAVKKALSQIQYVKRNGWFNTNEKKIGESLSLEFVYQCAYCGKQTTDVEGPCECRGFKKPSIFNPLASL